MIILTTDNGPWTNYGNHAGSSGGLREAKATTFNGGVRVPCIVYQKGLTPEGMVYNGLTSNIDIFPTIAELSGAPLPNHKIDGISFAEVVKGESEEVMRDNLCFYYHKNSLEAVTDGLYKLVFPHTYVTYYTQVPGNDGQPGKLATTELKECELYDLRRDPGERVNVISQHPEIAAKLIKIADQYRNELGDDLTGHQGTERREVGLRDEKQNQ